MHRGLGDAVHVDQARQARVVLQPGPKALRLKRFPAEHHSLELQLLGQFGLHLVGGLQGIERRRASGSTR